LKAQIIEKEQDTLFLSGEILRDFAPSEKVEKIGPRC
jgi:hypothetical protein